VESLALQFPPSERDQARSLLATSLQAQVNLRAELRPDVAVDSPELRRLRPQMALELDYDFTFYYGELPREHWLDHLRCRAVTARVPQGGMDLMVARYLKEHPLKTSRAGSYMSPRARHYLGLPKACLVAKAIAGSAAIASLRASAAEVEFPCWEGRLSDDDFEYAATGRLDSKQAKTYCGFLYDVGEPSTCSFDEDPGRYAARHRP